MQAFIISFMNKFGYLGITFLIALENVFPPIPSEVILGFGGFMTTYTKLNVIGVILFATIGSIVGAIILYYIGKLLNKERLKKIVNGKIGKLLFLKESDIDSSFKWFDTKGYRTVFFCRFVPVVRSLISIPAGMSKMNFIKFLILTTIGSLIWNTFLVIIGSLLGNNWESLVLVIDKYSFVVLLLIIIFIIIFVYKFYKSRLKNKRDF